MLWWKQFGCEILQQSLRPLPAMSGFGTADLQYVVAGAIQPWRVLVNAKTTLKRRFEAAMLCDQYFET
jgi:hypothetical protein